MKQPKLWRVLALLLAFGLVAAACGDSDEDAESGDTTEAESSDTTAAEESTTTEAEATTTSEGTETSEGTAVEPNTGDGVLDDRDHAAGHR